MKKLEEKRDCLLVRLDEETVQRIKALREKGFVVNTLTAKWLKEGLQKLEKENPLSRPSSR